MVINWLLGFVYDHFLNKNVYACAYKIFPLVLEVTNSWKYFIHHWLNILLLNGFNFRNMLIAYAYACVRVLAHVAKTGGVKFTLPPSTLVMNYREKHWKSLV